MDTNGITNTLSDFGLWRRAFTPRELLELSRARSNCETLRGVLLNDKRFIVLETSDECFFVATSTVFRWFAHLTTRLAAAHLTKLTAQQLARSMSSLRLHGQWDTPPAQAIGFGHQFGFIIPTQTPGCYIFPLARLLSYLSAFRMKIARSVLMHLAEEENRSTAFREPIEYSVRKGLALFDERVVDVVERRECLLNNTKATLEDISADRGVTRERIRQMEAEFWDSSKLLKHSQVQMFFLKGLLCEVMRRKGSLLINATSFWERFALKCMGIPFIEIPHTGRVILGGMSKDIAPLIKPLDHWVDLIDVDVMASQLESNSDVCLCTSDLKSICRSVASFCQKHLSRAKGVYITLHNIGKPAHYSEVARRYNQLFPHKSSNEHNIHAVLTRESHGVVWIGAKGMFALEEWGYKRPSKSIFETVEEIVETSHKRTGKPVPLTVIVAEFGKYRRFINPSSLIIATHCNPSLQRVSRDFFIPKKTTDQTKDESSADELDRILREF